jgi:nucleoside-diphosphate-sugar epimerase
VVKKKYIACVTGATGKIGSKIVQQLLDKGFIVNVLSRSEKYFDNRVKHFKGDLENKNTLYKFVHNADLLFHCAAELYDPQKMVDVNVKGTEHLLDAAKNNEINYLCYISSAGVVGLTNDKIVDENTSCNPITTYEKTKWEAEKLVAKCIDGCRTVILRPTNVIDETRPGALSLPMNGSLRNWLKVVVKGGECAHIIHAEDVAAAAMYFVSHKFNTSRCFFVSCDHEPLNTFAGLWSLYNAIQNRKPVDSVQPIKHLPIFIPFILRRLVRGHSNKGDVRYSSKKLLSEGFKFTLGLEGAIKRVVDAES